VAQGKAEEPHLRRAIDVALGRRSLVAGLCVLVAGMGAVALVVGIRRVRGPTNKQSSTFKPLIGEGPDEDLDLDADAEEHGQAWPGQASSEMAEGCVREHHDRRFQPPLPPARSLVLAHGLREEDGDLDSEEHNQIIQLPRGSHGPQHTSAKMSHWRTRKHHDERLRPLRPVARCLFSSDSQLEDQDQ